jgi:hypothetical protein
MNYIELTCLRRKIHEPNGWPCLRWGGRIYLNMETIRQLLRDDTRSSNPTRGFRSHPRRSMEAR